MIYDILFATNNFSRQKVLRGAAAGWSAENGRFNSAIPSGAGAAHNPQRARRGEGWRHGCGQTHLSCQSAPTANQVRRRRRPAELTLLSAGAIAQPSARQPASWHPKASQGNGGHRAWADAPQPSPIEDVHAFAIAITIGLIGALRNTAGTGRSSARQTRRARAIGAGL